LDNKKPQVVNLRPGLQNDGFNAATSAGRLDDKTSMRTSR